MDFIITPIKEIYNMKFRQVDNIKIKLLAHFTGSSLRNSSKFRVNALERINASYQL